MLKQRKLKHIHYIKIEYDYQEAIVCLLGKTQVNTMLPFTFGSHNKLEENWMM